MLLLLSSEEGHDGTQVAPYQQMAAMLRDMDTLAANHWDAAAAQFRDWGNHTEAVELQWRTLQTPDGRPISRDLIRVAGPPPPVPQFVPHFG